MRGFVTGARQLSCCRRVGTSGTIKAGLLLFYLTLTLPTSQFTYLTYLTLRKWRYLVWHTRSNKHVVLVA